MWIYISIIIGVFGFVLGFLFGKYKSKVDGLFIVDDSDPETTRWTLDVRFDPEDILNKKEVRLKVKSMNEGDV